MHGIVSLTTLATYVSLLAAISASAATNTTFSKDGANVIVLSPGYIPPTIFRGPRDPKTFKISTANGPLPNLVYSGGPIIRNVTVQPIFYGNINFAPQITAFYQGVTQSSWMDLLAQYGTWGGTSLSPLSVSATIDFSKGYITDQDIQDYLKRLVRSGAILPTVNMYFPIHFPSGIRIQSGRDGNNNPQYSCTNFCGYHGAIDVSDPSANLGLDFKVNTQTQFLYYGVMPDITDSTCACHNTPNRGYLADALSVAAHELAEAATDGVPSLQFLGWYDFNITPGGEEIADICAWKFDKTLSRFDGKSYDVQQLWSNNDAGCMTAGSTAQADPAIGTGCYPAFDVSQAYIPGSVASRVDPKNPSVFYNIKRDVSGWIQGSVCNQKLNTACYPTYKCDNVSSVDGTQVWCGSTNAIRKGTALNSIGICVVYPTNTTPPTSTKPVTLPTPTQLVGIGTDYNFWFKSSLSAEWSQLPPQKALDVIQLPDTSFVTVGMDNTLNTCQTLSNTNTCSQVPGSGSVKSIDLLSDNVTFIAVGMDNKLYTRWGILGSWNYIPNSGYVVDITVLRNGVILGTSPDGSLYTRQSVAAPWILVPYSCCVSRTAMLLDGSIIGVGSELALYRRLSVESNWILLPNTQSVFSAAQVSIMPAPKIILYGIGMEKAFYGKYTLASPWIQISGFKALDLIQIPDGSFVTVGLDNLLYTCQTLSSCTQVVGSGSVTSIDLLPDKSTFVGVGMEGQLYTRSGISGGWNLIWNSGTVVDITVLKNGGLLGTGPDAFLYTRQTLTSTWIKVEGSCCVSRTEQLPDGSILGVGSDNAIYQKLNLDPASPWYLVPNSKSVLSIGTTC